MAWGPRARPKPPLASEEPLGLWWLRASMPEDGLDGSVLMKEPQLELRCRSSADFLFSSLWTEAGSQICGGRGVTGPRN